MDGYELARGVPARPLLLLRGCRTLPAVLFQHHVINSLDTLNYSAPRFWMLVYVDNNVGKVVSIHDSAVYMIVAPSTRFTKDPDTFPSLQPFTILCFIAGFPRISSTNGMCLGSMRVPFNTP